MDAKDIAEELQETNVDDETLQDVESIHPEKMVPAYRVEKLIKKAKYKGEQKMQEQLDAARQQIEQLQAQQAQQQVQNVAQTGSQQPPQQMQQQPQGQPQGVDQQQVMQQIMQQLQMKQQEEQEKREREQLEQEVNQVAQQYFGKMAQGKDMFEDFEAITADFNPAEFPQLVFMANQMDNTPAIIYELRKNPGKLADLAVLVERSPTMARNELSKLSESIKRNDEAKRNLQEPQDPLNRLKPSPVGTDNGAKNVRDFKAASYLRG